MIYFIEIDGRLVHYASLAEAERVAREIFIATGIIVGIEACEPLPWMESAA